jgi:hypothetical protein
MQVDGGYGHTVGLKLDATVVAVGWNEFGQLNVNNENWENTISVAAGGAHTVGCYPWGYVVATGNNVDHQCDVGDWSAPVVQVSGGWDHTVGLKADGSVVAAGLNSNGQCDVDGWNLLESSLIPPGIIDVISDLSSYDLTISCTAGGSVTEPGVGVFTYLTGSEVSLMAEPEAGYRFAGWSGDVDTLGPVNWEAASITVNGDYSITAEFEEIPPPVDWLLIGVVIAVVIVVVLLISFVRRRSRGNRGQAQT